MSPDAFIQMAMQLAWYKACGEFTATYETVLTRMFKHGRTETLRSFSRESWRWVLSMIDPLSSVSVYILFDTYMLIHPLEEHGPFSVTPGCHCLS